MTMTFNITLTLTLALTLTPTFTLMGMTYCEVLCLSDLDYLHKIFREPYLSAEDDDHDLHPDFHLDVDLDLEFYHDHNLQENHFL